MPWIPGSLAGSGEKWNAATGSDVDQLDPTGIASEEAFGTAVVTVLSPVLSPSGVASGEAIGTPLLSSSITVVPSGIASAEAFGTAAVSDPTDPAVAPAGVASAEAFGTAVVVSTITVSPSGIASGEAAGTPTIARSVTLGVTGIASEEAFGTPVVTAGPRTLSPTGIASAGALGTPQVLRPYPAGVLLDSPLAYYRLGESSGTAMVDVSGNALNGLYVSSPTLGATGLVYNDPDTAVHFVAASSDEATSSTSATLRPSNLVIEVLIQNPSNASGAAIWRDDTSSGGWLLNAGVTGGTPVQYRVSGTTYTTTVDSSVLQDGLAHHVVMRAMATTVDLWIDGVQVHTATRSGTAAPSGKWHLARNGSTSGQYCDVVADEWAFYSSLADASIVTHAYLALNRVTLAPAGIASAEAFGSTTVQPGSITLGPSSIASAEAVGTPRIPPPGDLFAAPVTLVTSGSMVANNIDSTQEPGEPELDASADWTAGTIWFRYVPTTSGTLTVSTAGLPGYAAVIEAFSGEESLGTVQSIGVADAATGLEIAVGEGVVYRLRLYPVTAGDERNDIPLTWTFVARTTAGDGVLADLVIDITPGLLDVDLGNGEPGDTVDFYLDGDFGTLVLEDDFDDNGTIIGASVPVSERPAGDYVLNVRSGSYSVDLDFSVLNDPESEPLEPQDPIEDIEVPSTDDVLKWRIVDPAPISGQTFVFEINPEEMDSPRPEHTYTVAASTAPDGQPITWQGMNKRADWTFGGWIINPEQLDDLADLCDLQRRVWVYDHLNRRVLVSLEQLDAVPNINAQRPYLHRFTLHTVAHTSAHHVDELPED